ncbi:hypothetical protein FOE78_01800 [Microlunatus elymi]|uniref:Plasmid replication, integration and excision activator n=1 Tax=Microlunatus elymi TaxID=2596828 RepID=A0A516PV48_9ACTN|nr:hypothetical protein [Microlunatus elymi]QDP94821.1 hypothetical protein FOE78_01800 [Microlunatus elymi]
MAIQGPFTIDCKTLFPLGCGVVSAVTPINDFERSTRENPVQSRDRETGLPMWSVDVIDFDPDARERTFKVKIAAEVQPIPPEAVSGVPVRPVYLEGLQMTPYIKEGGIRPKIAYSLRCSGLSAPKNAPVAKPDGGRTESGRAA